VHDQPKEDAMQADYLNRRVEILEKTVDGANGLVEQVALLRTDVREFRADFLQFKDETRAEFSAVRHEMREMGAQLRIEMREIGEQLRTEMRVLHEDVIARLTVIGEGLNGRRHASPRKTRR
jgi:hypothetical protein